MRQDTVEQQWLFIRGLLNDPHFPVWFGIGRGENVRFSLIC